MTRYTRISFVALTSNEARRRQVKGHAIFKESALPPVGNGEEFDIFRTRMVVAALAIAFSVPLCKADTFPTKPVHIFVPYAPGGAVDVLARTIGQALSKTWGRLPVIENRPGAGGILASQTVAQAAPDGYTIILVASGHPLNQFIYPKLPYDTFKSFTAISEIANSPLVIVVSKDNPAKDLQDVLAAARTKPDSLSYGMSGIGTLAHPRGGVSD